MCDKPLQKGGAPAESFMVRTSGAVYEEDQWSVSKGRLSKAKISAKNGEIRVIPTVAKVARFVTLTHSKR